ncbi:family A G protein-coupled receptor-like protein [Conidiobolus coronatus NRRL 28638]|uniref:Family A G protein-coupled receptor-like protein n=1 Tax=Conidiobolus coronatus (strain ATCC 28846 / CBS 209.66 / NRRL 28638) TaxID=796925 RepID=A0A137PHE3_CONC2|nr:family A G protein-coupled receptor-like protein [Conidiobolus coronatus NRRL 28638]|eukprot:KXN74424.1 family A G protein-coupled receptor-like protein [Conidiobolus coronatus NRRL 28638]
MSNSSTPSIPQISDELRHGISVEYMLLGVFGGILNTLILTVLIQKIKKSSHTDVKLSAIVVITDLIVSSGLFIRSIVGLLPYHLLELDQKWCLFDFIFTAQFLIFSGYSLGVMSLERFFLICLGIEFPFIFWVLLVAISWLPQIIYSFINMSYPNIILVGRTKTACTMAATGPGFGYFILFTVFFFLSFFSVIIGYVGIMIVKFKQCIKQINMNVPKEQVYKDLRTTGKFFILLYELTTGKKRTIEMDAVSNCMVSCSVIANPLVLLYMNNEIREGFVTFIKKIKDRIF